MRKKIVAGNWKMNKDLFEASSLITELKKILEVEHHGAAIPLVCVPFPFLQSVSNQLKGSLIQVGAQNCSQFESGAYTGEVSALMIKSLSVPYVIIGHSERRQYFAEDSSVLAKKVDQCITNGLVPIFCCGEPLEVRESGGHNELVKSQIRESLFHLTAAQLNMVVIAYEPVWAIGTGKTASASQAQEMHAVIRGCLKEKYGESVADSISILYGGSVKAENAKELFTCPDVDGGLVGGASLKAREFSDIVKAAG